MIMNYNMQVPIRILSIIVSSGEDSSPILQKMALDLQNLKYDFLAMPCNTANYYHSVISKSFRIPLLNMLKSSV